MASDQYEIPDSSPLREALNAADAAQHTPEAQPEAFAFLEVFEHTVDTLREQAVAQGKLPNRRWLSAIDPFSLNTRAPIDRLIELESRAAGKKLFGKDRARFWLHKKHPGDSHATRHWYYSYHPKNKDERPIAIHYERAPDAIHKLYEGIEYPMSSEEIEQFIQAVEHYAGVIALEVYSGVGPKQDYGLAA